MRKKVKIVLTFLLVFALFSQSVYAATLRVGSRGSEVKKIQQRLNELGYKAGKADGIFGQATKSAVMAFQRSRGLSVDGIVGSKTMNALYGGSTSSSPQQPTPPSTPPSSNTGNLGISRTLRYGSRGSDVAVLQNRLNALGYNAGKADGIFGQGTKAAVIAFQRSKGLSADGIAGSKTLAKLFPNGSQPAPAPNPEPTPKPEPPNYTNRYMEITKDTPLYESINGSPNKRVAVAGKTYKILEHKDNWYKIKFGSKEGWIPSGNAKLLDNTPKDKISMAWNYIHSPWSNTLSKYRAYIEKPSVEQGLDVISPTWFEVGSTNGSTDPSTLYVIDNASQDYVDTAHSNGYEVWALFKEFNGSRFNKMFKDQDARSRIISQVVSYAQKYDLDGINIDFEALGTHDENKDGLTAFVRDLSSELKKSNIIVSIDVVKAPGSEIWSSFYDRAKLKDYVDYMILMGYDEHVEAYNPGPVGAISWVEDGIRNLIETNGVPKEKIILGVPFYTRDWIEGDTRQVGAAALTMKQAMDKINAANDEVITFDSQAGSDKAVFTDTDGRRHIIWIENQKSMGARLDLVSKYGLKGASAWMLTQETPDIWNVIKSKLK